MTFVDSTPLHGLIGGRVRWTEPLWRQAFEYLHENLTVEGSAELERLLLGSASRRSTVDDRFREFRRYPPTVLLGIYDALRWQDRVRARAAHSLDVAGAAGQRSAWEKPRGRND